MKRLLWWAVFIILLGGSTVAFTQHVPRFHRYALTPIDMSGDVKGVIDLVKDAGSGKCYAVYVLMSPDHRTATAVAATSLGIVDCGPLPVPAPRVPPPASPVR
jgi:hypothetical protein